MNRDPYLWAIRPLFGRLRVCALALVLALALASGACGAGPEPVYRRELGVESIPVPEGAMAGTFGLLFEVANLVDAPLIGKQAAGSRAWYLLHRSYEPGVGYTQSQGQCDGVINRVAGNQTTIPKETRNRVPTSTTHLLTLNDDTGTYGVSGHLELWGLEYQDPYTAILPADKDEAKLPAFASHIVDLEQDGFPGVTAHIKGIVSGDQYFVQRRVVNLDGILLGPDHLIGLVDDHAEQIAIGGSNRIMASQSKIEPDPNPLLSWFEEIRLADDAQCTEVEAAVLDGRLGQQRPF